MHTLCFGYLNTFVAVVFWRCVRHNVFAVEGTNEEVLQNTCLHMCASIFSCHRRRKAEHKGVLLSETTFLQVCFGHRDRPNLSAKAVETRHLEQLRTHAPLLMAGEVLAEYLDLGDVAPVMQPRSTLEAMVGAIGLWCHDSSVPINDCLSLVGLQLIVPPCPPRRSFFALCRARRGPGSFEQLHDSFTMPLWLCQDTRDNSADERHNQSCSGRGP